MTDVEQATCWRAYCKPCGWFGEWTTSEVAADIEADEHDDENHEGGPR